MHVFLPCRHLYNLSFGYNSTQASTYLCPACFSVSLPSNHITLTNLRGGILREGLDNLAYHVFVFLSLVKAANTHAIQEEVGLASIASWYC